MLIENDYNVGDTVYLKTDDDQRPRMVVGIIVRLGEIMYVLTGNGVDSYHYGFEMTAERDPLRAVGVNTTEEE